MNEILTQLPGNRANYTKHRKQDIEGQWYGTVYENEKTGEAYGCRNMANYRFIFVKVSRNGAGTWTVPTGMEV